MKISENCSSCFAKGICSRNNNYGNKNCNDFHKALESKLQSAPPNNKSSFQFPKLEEVLQHIADNYGGCKLLPVGGDKIVNMVYNFMVGNKKH